VKLHQLKPARGSRRARTRVGRGIAAGQGKTAGRGTKGQKARAGASIPGWFEGGQTPIHIRVPKLRGFRSPFKIDYQVVNIGRIAEYATGGRFGVELAAATGARKRAADTSDAPVTVNPENLAAAGLVNSPTRPVKVLGHGDVAAKLFVVADAFTGSAKTKIEAAGGFVQLLNPPIEKPADEKPPKSKSKDKAKTSQAPDERAADEPATAAGAQATEAAASAEVQGEASVQEAEAGAPGAVAEPPASTDSAATPARKPPVKRRTDAES
jgi:large subunit ribosomal protein L15